MRAELPTFSILSACIILVALPLKCVWRDIPSACLLLWLLAWNVIHAVNAITWAGNENVRALVWCDLATKVMLAAVMGVSGCAFCMLRVLEFLSSARKSSPNARRNTVSIEILLCIVIPILYMILHFVVQDHRFAIAADIGCLASVHPSSPSLILMWLPLALECVAAFALSCIAVHHATRLPSTLLDEHLSTRTSISSSLLLRNLCFASATCSLVVIAVLFAVFSPTLIAWQSWKSVHAHMKEVILVRGSDRQAAEVMWWIAPVVTFLWLLCFVVLGSERREIVASFRDRFNKVFNRTPPPSARSESTVSFSNATDPSSLKSKCTGLTCTLKRMLSGPRKTTQPPKVKARKTMSMICEDIVGIPFSDRSTSSDASVTNIDPSPVPSSRFSVATTAVGSGDDAPSGWRKIKDSLRLPEQRPRAPVITVPLSIRTDGDARDSAHLRSGWDDMLDGQRKPPIWHLKKIVIPGKSASPTRPAPERRSSDETDDAFRENTLEYMESPVARTLGLVSPSTPPLVSPPPAYTSPQRRGVLERPPSITPPRPPSLPLGHAHRLSIMTDLVEGRKQLGPQDILVRGPPVSQSIPEDAKSTISSICRAPWPEPPCSPPALPIRWSSTHIAAATLMGADPMVAALGDPSVSAPAPALAAPPSPVPSHHSRNSSDVFGAGQAPGFGQAL
ncbi:pheromone A receptor-domain-containing protein [Schizophyllum fasciatum]